MKATEFLEKIRSKTGSSREKEIATTIQEKAIPEFLNKENFAEILVKRNKDTLRYFVSKDYFSIGEDSDYLVMPVTPLTLEPLLEALDCCLPTVTMVNQIYQQAEFRIPARPQNPQKGESRTSTRLYVEIDKAIKKEREKRGVDLEALVAGHKKDVVLTNTLLRKENKGNVAIYGWFYSDGTRIQNLNSKDHTIDYVDYSHGLRLISNKCFLNDAETTIQNIWNDPASCLFLHDEVLRFQKY